MVWVFSLSVFVCLLPGDAWAAGDDPREPPVRLRGRRESPPPPPPPSLNFTSSCASFQWKCSSDGKCIDQSQRCDGYQHCSDLSDENDCHGCDESRFFRCRNGECISKFFLCDGHPDCTDRSDEVACVEEESACPLQQFRCKGNNLCFPQLWRCDGAADCPDHSDEEDCPTKPNCTEQQFRCGNGVCVSLDYVCNGDLDCRGGEDEAHCETSRCNANPNHYQCKDGSCLEPEKVCDGRRDCADGSDEGGLCSRQCKVGDCSDQCYSTPGGPHCACLQGYFPLSEKECADVDECRGNVSVCDHFCQNIPGGFRCSCGDKYSLLLQDNRTCLSDKQGYGFLVVAMNREIREIYLNATLYTSVYAGFDLIQSVAYDPVEDKVYWSNSIIVFRKGRMTMEEPERVVTKGIRRVESLAVDWYGRNLYIGDSGIQKIVVCSLDGQSCGVLVGSVSPRTLRLDIRNRLLFWTDTKALSITKAGMDGSRPKNLVSGGIKIPNGLALDQPARRVYWMDAGAGLHAVQHVSYDGTDRKHVPSGAASHPYSLDVWESRLYWSDLNHEHVRSCLKTSGKGVQSVLKGSSRNDFYGICLYHSSMIDQGSNPCGVRPCSHLCLLVPGNGSGYRCACPAEMDLSGDRHSCRGKPQVASPFLSDGGAFYRLFSPPLGLVRIERWFPLLQVERVGDFAYNPLGRSVIVSDIYAKTLLSVPLESGRVRHIMDNVAAVGLSFDWLRNNVYWVDGEKRVVEVVSSRGFHRAVLGNASHSPTDIAVAPLQGYYFMTDAGPEPFIRRCGLDGRGCLSIVTERLYKPFAIVMDKDPERERIYWCDKGAGRVETAGTDGSRRVTLKMNLYSPVSLLVSKDYFMWTLEGSDRLYIASTATNDTSVFGLKLGNAGYGIRVLQLADVGWDVPTNASLAFCQQGNGGCSQLCLGNSTHTQVCACGLGYQLDGDRKRCNPVTCRKNFFSCGNSHECILNSFKCDGTPDCPDGSDEKNCSSAEERRTCLPDEFRCSSSGHCVSRAWVCDGHKDCSDGSDEMPPECLGSNRTCRANFYACATGQCIPAMWHCDGRKECEDGSDEEGCPTGCPEHKFACDNGDCIPDVWRCDGSADCKDGSDEHNCTGLGTTKGVSNVTESPLGPRCLDYEVPCAVPEGHSPICVHENSRCDGVYDCPDREDEMDCGCEEDQFKCLYTDRCIPKIWICNGVSDCMDSTDESDCPSLPGATVVSEDASTTLPLTTNDGEWLCRKGEYACRNGQCIRRTMICDGSADCDDGSDEWNHCYQNCQKENGGCQHVCHSNTDEVYCSCHRGFHLHIDGSSCLDDPECDEESTCSHYCTEMKGSYFCSCMEGYSLEPDRRTCKPTRDKEWALVAGSEGILNMTTHLQLMSRIPLEEEGAPSSLDYDPTTRSFVYADANGYIVKMASELEGPLGEDVSPGAKDLFRRCSNPQGVSIDTVSRNLYFSEFFENPPSLEPLEKPLESKRSVEGAEKVEDVYSVIHMCSLRTRRCTQIYKAFNVKVPSTRVAPEAERFFYCTNHQNHEDQGQILVSKLDGMYPQVVHQKKVVHCGALALDLPKERVYWTDLVLNSIQSVAWDGTGYRIVIEEGVHRPVGLALSGEYLMWYNRDGSRMVRCHKYYRTCERKLIDSRDAANKFEGSALISIGGPRTNVTDPCRAKNCSHLCTAVQGKGKCLCGVGHQPAQDDPRTCLRVELCPGKPCVIGVCELLSSKRFVCRCPTGHSGMLCEVTQDDLGTSSNAGTAVAVVIVVLLVVAFAAGLLWYRRQPFVVWVSKRRTSNQTYRFSNPAFGVMADTPIVSSSSKSPVPSSCASHGTSNNPPFYVISNPQEGESGTEESPFSVVEVPQVNTSMDSAVASGTESASFSVAFNKVDLDSPIPKPNYLQEEQTEAAWRLSPYNPQLK